MGIPTNIETLLGGTVVESVRLEFKKGWNPEPILHNICAFANDINDLGGGYILVGIEEENGKIRRPIRGLEISSIDSIQKELLQNCRLITPSYIPVVEPVIYEDKNILIIWCPSGHTRPYKCPVTLDRKKSKNYVYYIRKMSSTIKATSEDEKELFSLASHIPFDDKINYIAEIGDLKLGLIQAYLYEIKSELYKESENMKFIDLCKSMRIVGGPIENIRPLNVGLMFFNNEPQNFFPYSQIEIVDLRNGPEGDDMKEKIFKGPIDQMLRNALNFIKDLIIIEKIEKVNFQPEAIRYFNYPYQAIEEALANAIYHRRI